MLARSIDGYLSDGTPAYMHVADPDDCSEPFDGYAPECGLCWLGGPHSVELHSRRVRGLR